MKVLVASKSWPLTERSGVSLIAAQHVELLLEMGFEVSILGSNITVLDEHLAVHNKVYVEASGSGSIYSPERVNRKLLFSELERIQPDVVMVESWQTAITHAVIESAYLLGIPVFMISHGVSVHPFSNGLMQITRSLGWFFYRYYRLV